MKIQLNCFHFQWRGTLRRAGGSGSSFNSGTLTNGTANLTTVQSHHLMCSMRDFGHTAGGDEAELLLWLHDARRGQPLSERFRVRIARDGFSNYVDRLHANSTLFAVSNVCLDLCSSFFTIYHWARLVRSL